MHLKQNYTFSGIHLNKKTHIRLLLTGREGKICGIWETVSTGRVLHGSR